MAQQDRQNNIIGITGERYWVRQMQVTGFHGNVQYLGNVCVRLDGNFGIEMTPLIAWKRGVRIHAGEPISLWLEYQTEGEIALELTIRLCRQGTTDEMVRIWRSDLTPHIPLYIDPGPWSGTLSLNLAAKGSGSLRVGTLHARRCLADGGCFLQGTYRICTPEREEVFSHLDDIGESRPPLVVYFADYDSREGFQQPAILREQHVASLLFTDPRLEGGMFYLGSDLYEKDIEDTIRIALDYLNWSDQHLVFMGTGMGAYGALYYAAKFRPAAVLLGTPIFSPGRVALNEMTRHPGKMETLLDILLAMTGGTDEAHAHTLDQRLWERLAAADFYKTQIAVARMLQDDYDPHAYEHLVEHMKEKGVRIYDKSFSGRHDESRQQVESWLELQLTQLLQLRFHKKITIR